MNTHPSLEKAQSYLHLQLGDSRPPMLNTAEGPYVTISRESGAGGSSLARILADVLNQQTPSEGQWSVYDANLIESMLRANSLEPRIARYLPEDSVSEIHASVGELVGLHPSLWQLTQKTNEMIRKLARTGRAIIVGRGGNFATASIANGVHVRLVASPKFRAQYMAKQRQLGDDEAANLNQRQDSARERYVRSTFSASISDPASYDLVIATDRVPLTHAAEMVASLVRIRTPIPS